MGVEHGGVARDLAVPHEVDETGHGLALVDRVDDDALEPAGEVDRLDRAVDGDAVQVARPSLEDGDLVVTKVATELDELGRVAGDPGDLVPRLLDRRRGVDAEYAPANSREVLEGGEAGDHPGVGR